MATMQNPTGLLHGDFLGPVQKGVFKVLNGQVKTMTGAVVLVTDNPTKDTAPPFCIIGPIQMTKAFETKTRSGEELIFEVGCYSDYLGNKESIFIGDQVQRLVTSKKVDLSADGKSVISCQVKNARNEKLSDGLTVIRVIQFMFQVMDAE